MPFHLFFILNHCKCDTMKQFSHFTLNPPQAQGIKELLLLKGASFLLYNSQMDFTQLDWRPQVRKETENWNYMDINIVQRNTYFGTVQKCTCIHAAFIACCLICLKIRTSKNRHVSFLFSYANCLCGWFPYNGGEAYNKLEKHMPK